MIMSKDTVGIIIKSIKREEIIAVLERNFKNLEVWQPEKPFSDKFGYMSVDFKAGRYEKDLRVLIDAELSDSEKRDYGIEFERDCATFLVLSHTEDSAKIMKTIISPFGGYIKDDDSSKDGYYKVDMINIP
jgi:hypothetical protein